MPSESHGRVTAFDEHKGYGVVTADDGTAYFLHCTQIADGTRSIEVGTEVAFEVLARLGRYEATEVRPA
jgi:cold shock CspA family protein